MIILEPENLIISSILEQRVERAITFKQEFVDFDGVQYLMQTPEKKSVVQLSFAWRAWDDLVAAGVDEIVQREYAGYVGATEPGYNLSLEIDLERLPADAEARAAEIHRLSLLRRNLFAAPFERAIAEQKALERHAADTESSAVQKGTMYTVHARPEETIFIQPSTDRVTVIFSTVFREETDRVIGKVFLQEFVDARKQASCQNAPQVLYTSREPPLEIRHIPGLSFGDDIGYITFVLFPRHLAPHKADQTITMIQMFRNYFHYHIKCSKAYMHSRMRTRVSEFLKVLNRAKPDAVQTEQKTASGRTFVRA